MLERLSAHRRVKQHEAKASQRRKEDWLWDAVAMDLVMRMHGTYSQSITSDDTTTSARSLDGGDTWLARARAQVEFDDMPEMRGLVQRETNSLRVRETAKGYAFLQYLLERDEEKAVEFVRWAAVIGGEAAAKKVYTMDLSELEPRYREWALFTLPRD